MSLPGVVRDLIARFEANREVYRSPGYKEAQLRVEFLNPLFEALEWDVSNRQSHAEAYKEVVSEDSLRIAGDSKAPDYAFRIGGVRKFFVEAKKPSVSLANDPVPAYQLRRYAWSAKLTLSILTDFEEWAIYDTRIKPGLDDKASVARIRYFTYTELAENWEFLVSTFSRDAILKGAFDKYAEAKKSKRGTMAVDDAFLGEIEKWRDQLARNLAARNSDLDQRSLNFAVQRIIDRIIFLRICEDRGIEEYGRLSAITNGNHTYRRLCELFWRADERYNSGLFHFRKEKDRDETPDDLTLGLTIDDKVLKEILGSLYYPESPYEFSVLPADILGQVYERFLGKVIRLTAGHQAKVEEKPEVKKAGGVYYTPTYIVDFIVKETLGVLASGRTPKDMAKIRVVDPACGSGSFLIGAYQYLLDWHRDWYEKDGPANHRKELKPGLQGGWHLTTAARKQILLNSIHGVDIDPQAVEVTKLSLLLKVLEGETRESVQIVLDMDRTRALPDLGKNIKCGNSLIGPDFYDGKQLDALNDEERYRLNVFDWKAEFPTVFKGKNGGFDAVVGNPPYGMILDEELAEYYAGQYEAIEGRLDHFELFIERGLGLAAPQGYFGYIVPSPLLSNQFTRKLRQFLLKKTSILSLATFGYDVFSEPTVHTCILVVTKSGSPNNLVAIRSQVASPSRLGDPQDYDVRQDHLSRGPLDTFDITLNPVSRSLIDKLESVGEPLSLTHFIRQCIKTGDDTRYVRSASASPGAEWKPALRGKGVVRYGIVERDLYLKYGPWLARNWNNLSFFETDKIVIRETGSRPTATIDRENRYLLSSLYSVYPKETTGAPPLELTLAILNSRLGAYFLQTVALAITQGAFSKLRTNQLGRLPIPPLARSHGRGATVEKEIVGLVTTLLVRGVDKSARAIDRGDELGVREGRRLHSRIDALVYELYGLTEMEIRLVEESTAE